MSTNKLGRRRARSASSSQRDYPIARALTAARLIAPRSFDMINIEAIFLKTRERPSDEGVTKNQFDWPAGETVRSLLGGVVNVDRFVYSLAPIGEFDVDFEGTAVTLDDVVTRSSRLFVRPRVDGADSAVVFLYAADGNPGTPVVPSI